MKNETENLPAAAASPQPCEDDRASVQRLHNALCADLDRIKKRFIGNPKVALVVRFDDRDKGIWLTDDTADAVIEYIRYMEARNSLAQGGRQDAAAGKDS